MTDELIILVTVPSRADAERIAEALVGELLAACVNVVGPIHSIYRWEGRICRDDEHLLLIKSTRAAYPALEARVKALHTYDVPEIVAVPIAMGSADYLGWIKGVTGNR